MARNMLTSLYRNTHKLAQALTDRGKRRQAKPQHPLGILEVLEPRLLLTAVLDLVPDQGTVSEQNGATVVLVGPNDTLNVSAQVVSSGEAIAGFQLNFSQSAMGLVLSDWSTNIAAFGTDLDGTLNTSADEPDGFVSAITDLILSNPVLAPFDLGNFRVAAPDADGDHLLTINSGGTGELNTGLINISEITIAEYGDLIVRVDATSPTLTVDPLETTDSTPALSGTVNDESATIRATVAGQAYDATNDGDGTWSLADDMISPPLAEGTYDVVATATDSWGNVGTDSTTGELVIGRLVQGPAVSVDPRATNDTTPELTGTVGDPEATIQVTVGGQNHDATNNGDGTWTLPDDLISPLADGTYDVMVGATDAIENVGTDSTTDELTVDTTPPLVTVGTLFTNDPAPTLTGTVDDAGADIAVTLDGQTNTAINNGDGSWTLADNTIGALPDGTYDVMITAGDALGNVGTDATNDELTIDTTAPVLTNASISQDVGSAGEGLVTIDTTPELILGFSEDVFGDAGDVTVMGPDGSTVVPESASGFSTGIVMVQFRQLEDGLYTVTLDGTATITDLVGNPLGIDEVVTFEVRSIQPTISITGDTLGDYVLAGGVGLVNLELVGRPEGGNVQVYLSTDELLDEDDILVGQAQVMGTGGAVPITLDVDLGADRYFLIAVEDKVGIESGAVSRIIGAPIATIDARNRYRYFDHDGTRVDVIYRGKGSGLMVADGRGGMSVHLDPVGDRDSLIVRTNRAGDGETDMYDFVVNGSLNVMNAGKTRVLGDVWVSGSLRVLTLDDVGYSMPEDVVQDHHVRIEGVGQPTRMRFEQIWDTSIETVNHVSSVVARGWVDASGPDDMFIAPSVGVMRTLGGAGSNGNFEPTVMFSGAGDPRFTVRAARFAGELSGDWTVFGDTIAIVARETTDWNLSSRSNLTVFKATVVTNSTMDVDGNVGRVIVQSWDGGGIDADWMRSIVVTGSNRDKVNGTYNALLTLHGTEDFNKTLIRARIGDELGGDSPVTWTINGDVAAIVAGDVRNFTLDVNNVNAFRGGQMTNTVLDVDGRLGAVIAKGWDGGSVTAQEMRVLNIFRGDMNADVDVLGDSVLARVNVAGRIMGSRWVVNGPMNAITVGSTSDQWRANIRGPVGTLHSRGDLSGTVAASSFNRVIAGGNLVDVSLLAGTDIGDDVERGGTGPDADVYRAGFFGMVTIGGNVSNANIAAGLDQDTNEIIDPENSVIRAINVRGVIGEDGRFAAGTYPRFVSIGGQRSDPLLAPGFIAPPDLDFPEV